MDGTSVVEKEVEEEVEEEEEEGVGAVVVDRVGQLIVVNARYGLLGVAILPLSPPTHISNNNSDKIALQVGTVAVSPVLTGRPVLTLCVRDCLLDLFSPTVVFSE